MDKNKETKEQRLAIKKNPELTKKGLVKDPNKRQKLTPEEKKAEDEFLKKRAAQMVPYFAGLDPKRPRRIDDGGIIRLKRIDGKKSS